MNFGHKIAIGYTFFVLFIVVMAVMSFKQNFQLEEENYYEKELAFQDEITAENNYSLLEGATEINAVNAFNVVLPKELILHQTKVNVELKRPSNAKYDKSYVFELNNTNKIQLPTKGLISGVYNLKLTFEMDGKAYLYKTGIYLNLNN
jgi:hypothetical protein